MDIETKIPSYFIFFWVSTQTMCVTVTTNINTAHFTQCQCTYGHLMPEMANLLQLNTISMITPWNYYLVLLLSVSFFSRFSRAIAALNLATCLAYFSTYKEKRTPNNQIEKYGISLRFLYNDLLIPIENGTSLNFFLFNIWHLKSLVSVEFHSMAEMNMNESNLQNEPWILDAQSVKSWRNRVMCTYAWHMCFVFINSNFVMEHSRCTEFMCGTKP